MQRVREFLRDLITVDTRVIVHLGIDLHLRVVDIDSQKPFPFQVEVNGGDLPQKYVGCFYGCIYFLLCTAHCTLHTGLSGLFLKMVLVLVLVLVLAHARTHARIARVSVSPLPDGGARRAVGLAANPTSHSATQRPTNWIAMVWLMRF